MGNPCAFLSNPVGVRVLNTVCLLIRQKKTTTLKLFLESPVSICTESFEYLKGSEIHFDDGLSGKGFEIRNPNAESTCGCGKSFS